MFDFGIGSTELLVIAMIALIVVGPKDLPKLLKTIGKYVGKIKSMASEFQSHVEEAVRETGVDDLKKEFDDAGAFDFEEDFKKQEAELSKVFEDAALEPSSTPEVEDKPAAKKKKAAKKPAKKAARKPAKKTANRKTAAKKPTKKTVKKS